MVDFSRFQLVPSAQPIVDTIQAFSPQAQQQREFQRQLQQQQLQRGEMQLQALGQQQAEREFELAQAQREEQRQQVLRDTLSNLQESRNIAKSLKQNAKKALDGPLEGLVGRLDVLAGGAFNEKDPDFNFEEFAGLRRSAIEDPEGTIARLTTNVDKMDELINFFDEQELILTSTPLQRAQFSGSGAAKFVGTPQRVVRNIDGKDQAFLTGVVQDPSAPGGFRREDIPVEGEFVSTLGETAAQQQQRKLETERSLNDIIADRAKKKRLNERDAERLDDFINAGIDARGQLPNIKRGLELLNKVGTGGATARSKVVTDFFGNTSGDIAELNNILASNVLAGLANFKGALSDSERLFVEQMETGLSQGTEFNIRQLRRMEGILNRQVDRAKRAAKAADNQFALDELNRPIEAGGFGVSVDSQVNDESATTATEQPVFEVNF